eukprot:CAMPEP_0115666834 /NCGR_PEP_ID=MMETSP0272-20121206/49621_1 /TAXON_ID=71861 /ORGANISM="Scrippsiella trochoidea, Strain CCMP3099" /LENGTH=254 /DNA_ID=CAMNT_0003105347 /DNA_START=14 /DNA_END=774 /DNA_ORIENTATION=-
MASFLQQLAVNVVNGKEKLTETEHELLKTIRDEMKILRDATATDHKEDQHEIDRVRDHILACSEPNPKTEHVANMTAQAEATHAAVPYDSSELASDDSALTKELADKLLGDMHRCLQWAHGANASLVESHAKCDTAVEAFEEQKKLCNDSQAEFEVLFCDYHQTVLGGCESFEECRTTTIDEREKVHSEVQVTEKGRKAEFKAASDITCLLDVIEAKPAEQPAKLKECGNLAVDTSALDIMYHEVPEGKCDFSA